jgi:hypothetical protein
MAENIGLRKDKGRSTGGDLVLNFQKVDFRMDGGNEHRKNLE